MKGVDTIIASILILIISITAMFLALQLGAPSTQKTKEILLMQEGKNTLVSIDDAVRNVLSEGEGSTRVLKFSVSGGEYRIDSLTNSMTFSMDSRAQIVAEGVSKIEDGINFSGAFRMVYLNLSYDNVQVIGDGEFGKGYHTLTIRNNGYNSTTQKQMIYISLTPLAPPPYMTFTDNFNQDQTAVLFGTSTTSSINLNANDGLSYNVIESFVSMGGNFIYQRKPNAADSILTDCSDKQNAYAYDNLTVTCNGGGTRDGGYWWNNFIESVSGTVINVKFGVKLNTSGSRATKSSDDYWIEYGFASIPRDCTTVSTWIIIVNNQFPGSTLTWYNISNSTPVTWTNINNTCFRFRYFRTGADDGFIIYPDAFHIDVNFTIPSTYRTEIEHNSTVSYSGNLDYLNFSLNFSTNVSSNFNLLIYNFNSINWEICDTFNPSANIWYTRWCSKTTNPENYLFNGNIRSRLNETPHEALAEIKEDYIQYYVTYTQ